AGHAYHHRLGALPQVGEGVPERGDRLLTAAARGLRLGQVDPGAEGRAGMVEHHHAYRRVGHRGGERLPQLRQQRRGERVAVVRAVQGQRGHTWFGSHPYECVAHTGQTRTMPSPPPEGDPVPADGALPAAALAGVGQRGFGVYVHVPFCASRCGYCDFNTYTAAELGPGASRESYAEAVTAELAFAARVLTEAPPPRVDTVFVGGGTPTLLPPADLARILAAIDATWGLAADAEVTTEANPESVDRASLRALRAAGFTRISLGMQSVAPHVLRVLDR